MNSLLDFLRDRAIEFVLAHPVRVAVSCYGLYLVLFLKRSQFAVVQGIEAILVVVFPAYLLIPAFLRNASRTEHGSARFAGFWDILKKRLLTGDGVLLGRMNDLLLRQILRLPNEGHVIVIAPPGAGKTTGIVIPNALTYPGSMVISDIKGEIYRATAARRRAMGQNVFVIDPFKLTDAEPSGFDLLSLIRRDRLVDDCAWLAATIIPDSPKEQDVYWGNAARDILSALIGHVATSPVLAPEERHMGRVRTSIRVGVQSLMEILEEMQRSPEAFISGGANSFKDMPDKQREGVLGHVRTATQFLDSPGVVEALRRGDCDLRRIKREPMTIYLAISDEDLKAYAGFLRLIVAGTMAAMKRDAGVKPRHQVLFCLDEFPALGRTDFGQQAAVIRGSGGRLLVIAQALGQLKRIYGPEGFQDFMAISNAAVFFGASDNETRDYVSRMLGRSTVVMDTSSLDDSVLRELSPQIKNSPAPSPSGPEEGAAKALESQINNVGMGIASWLAKTAMALLGFILSGQNPLMRRQKQSHGRELMTPDEVGRLPPEIVLIQIQGCAPIRARRLSYFKDSEFRGLLTGKSTWRTGIGAPAVSRIALLALTVLGTSVGYWVWNREPKAVVVAMPAAPVRRTVISIPDLPIQSLFQAIELGDASGVEREIRAGADPKEWYEVNDGANPTLGTREVRRRFDRMHHTALTYALWLGLQGKLQREVSLALAETLLAQGADVNKGGPPLAPNAAPERQVKIDANFGYASADAAVGPPAPPQEPMGIETERNARGAQTPLYLAASFRGIAACKTLVARGVVVVTGTPTDDALADLVLRGQDSAKILLFHANKLPFRNEPLVAALVQAKTRAVLDKTFNPLDGEVIAVFLSAKIPMEYQDLQGLLAASAQDVGSLNLMLKTVEVGAEPRKMDDGFLLASAAWKGAYDIADFLIRQGVNVNATGGAVQQRLGDYTFHKIGGHVRQNRTALFYAAQQGHANVAKLLLDHGASPELADNAGWTPVLAAAEQGHRAMVELLHDHGKARLGVADNAGRGMLHYAAMRGHVEVIDYCLANKFNPDLQDSPDRLTPLHLAVDNNQTAAVEALIRGGANCLVGDRRGRTPLDYARQKSVELYNLLRPCSGAQ